MKASYAYCFKFINVTFTLDLNDEQRQSQSNSFDDLVLRSVTAALFPQNQLNLLSAPG